MSCTELAPPALAVWPVELRLQKDHAVAPGPLTEHLALLSVGPQVLGKASDEQMQVQGRSLLPHNLRV